MTHMGFVQQEALPAALFVAATDSPNGGRIAFDPGSHGADGFTTGDGQYDACMLDLEPGQVSGTGNGLKDREVRGSNGKRTRFSVHAWEKLRCRKRAQSPSIPLSPEFLALIVSRYTSYWGSYYSHHAPRGGCLMRSVIATMEQTSPGLEGHDHSQP